MTVHRRKPTRRRKTQPESQRLHVQVLLRLAPEVAERLRELGRSHARGASGVVTDLVTSASP